jgi:hypothetical protein
MNKHQEKRVLVTLLKRLERPKEVPRWVRLVRPALWLTLVVAFIALFQLAPHAGRSILYVAFGSALLGSITAGVLVYVASLKQWPAVAKHLNSESIRSRLSEIET